MARGQSHRRVDVSWRRRVHEAASARLMQELTSLRAWQCKAGAIDCGSWIFLAAFEAGRRDVEDVDGVQCCVSSMARDGLTCIERLSRANSGPVHTLWRTGKRGSCNLSICTRNLGELRDCSFRSFVDASCCMSQMSYLYDQASSPLPMPRRERGSYRCQPLDGCQGKVKCAASV